MSGPEAGRHSAEHNDQLNHLLSSPQTEQRGSEWRENSTKWERKERERIINVRPRGQEPHSNGEKKKKG